MGLYDNFFVEPQPYVRKDEDYKTALRRSYNTSYVCGLYTAIRHAGSDDDYLLEKHLKEQLHKVQKILSLDNK